MSNEKELHVKKIENGTVIDHIPAGFALDVLRILNINGREGYTVSVVMNVPSSKLLKKDIVKIEDRELKEDEVNKIALIAPKATINIIRGYKVFAKKKVGLPNVIKNIIRCPNPVCITNVREPIMPTFRIEGIEPLRLRCHYCDRMIEKNEILEQFKT
ncbi:MAG: aspartate carbamoyltransferase regulatory subunit [Candidatus Bathyarchaeia archaeon]